MTRDVDEDIRMLNEIFTIISSPKNVPKFKEQVYEIHLEILELTRTNDTKKIKHLLELVKSRI